MEKLIKTSFPHHFYFTLKGSRFHVGPITPSDKGMLQQGFQELSTRSRYLRFFSYQRKLNNYQLNYLTEVDGFNHVAWAIREESGDEMKPVGVGRFVRLKGNSNIAEVAITVVDSYQNSGMGRMLFTLLNILAGHVGIEILRCYALKENQFIMNVLDRFETLRQVSEGQARIVDIKVLPNHQAVPEHPETHRLIATMKKIEKKMGAVPVRASELLQKQSSSP